jgi:hypothetical protein
MLLLLTVSVFSKLTYAQCEKEKEEADKWNRVLKNKSTEYARSMHRESKSIYLDCIRQPRVKEKPPASPNLSKSPISQTQQSRKNKYYSAPRQSNSHITVSDYTNFKGKKKRAWGLYFNESAECLSNKSNMKMFVACAKVRKQNLKAFNARWNNQTQELMPLLENW